MPVRHPAFAVIAAAAAATTAAGCGGNGKVQRSTTPAQISAPSTGAATTPTGATGGATAGGVSGRFTGADVPTRYGDIQVALTLQHGRITDVQWLKLPFDRPRSQFISQQAAPILRSEVLAAQSAQINLLSGATYTSDAWATSVQAALSHAR